MLITIKNVLNASELAQFNAHLDQATWHDGGATAGALASQVKRNQQLDESSDVAISLGNHILKKLAQHDHFTSAALADKIYPPRFNRYAGGDTYGPHVDSAIMHVPNSAVSVRSDLSATLFLTEPDQYEGGALTINTEFGEHAVKLAAGDMILYPSSSVHHVTPVTQGVRTCAFFWIQSMVRSNDARATLYTLDQSIQTLTKENANPDTLTQLSGVYHNLLRQFVS